MKYNINYIFDQHKLTDNQIKKSQAIRESAKQLADIIMKNTPESADQDKAISLLREVVMFSNAAISLDGKLSVEDVLLKNIVEKLFIPIEAKNEIVTLVWLGLDDCGTLRNLSIFNGETRRELLQNQIFGYIWGITIKISKNIPKGYGAAFSENEAINNPNANIIENLVLTKFMD